MRLAAGVHRHGSSQPGGHGPRQREAATGRRQRAAASWAAAQRLSGAGEREKGEEGPHRRRSTTASDGGRWRRRDELRDHLRDQKGLVICPCYRYGDI
jgi:hypothetical protein